MDTQTQIDRLIELAIIQRSELKQLVEQLPQLREHLNAEVEKVFDETEPQLRAELEEWTTKQTADKTAALGVALEAKIADLAKSLEVSTQARYNAIIAEREENARLAAQAEAKIAEHAASLPNAVKEIVTAELARFPRAGEIDQLRKEFAEPRGLNPRGKWQAGETYNKLDLVTINGDSYTSNTDGNRTRPSRSSSDWTLVAARGTGGGGGPTSLSELTTVPSDGDLLIGSGTSWVTSNLTAGAGISITVGPGAITISATDGDITLDDGTAASPSLHFTNDPDTGIYRPAANTLGISVSGTQVAYFDENGLTVPSAGVVAGGSIHAGNGNANNPSLSFDGDQDTGFFRHQPNEIGVALGGTQKATLTSTTFTITPNLVVSGTGSINGTTIPASKTLVVTTDKLSALASTSSSELAGVISDETGTGALVFANTPTLVTPVIGAATGTSLTVTGNVTASDAILGSSGPSVKSSLSARAPRQGAQFNGTLGGTVAFPAPGTGDYTYAFWINPTNFSVTRYLLGANTGPTVAIFVNTAGQIGINNLSTGNLTGTASLTAGKWQLVTLRRTGTSLYIGINGIEEAAITDSRNYTVATAVWGASSASGVNDPWLGGLSGPYAYNRALSASEVVALYEAGAPAGADYNNASNTAINTSNWNNSNWPYTSYTGVSSTGFTAVMSTANIGIAEIVPTPVNGTTGQRIRVTFSATLTSGVTPTLRLFNAAYTTVSNAVALTAGSNTVELVATAPFTKIGFYTSGVTSYAVSGISVVRAGLLLAPDAAQAGGGLVWYDTSGNAANITLPASGVSWNVPSSGYWGGNLTVNGTGTSSVGGSFGIGTTTPTTINGIASAFQQVANVTGSGTCALNITGTQAILSLVDSNASANVKWLTLTNSNGVSSLGVLNDAGSTAQTGFQFFHSTGNFLFGTGSDGGQKLQVNGNSGFLGHLEIPADKHIYMKQGNPLRWSSDGLSTGTVRADIYADSGGILYFRTNGTTAALNIDASQNATFAGRVISNGTGYGVGANSDANTPFNALTSINGTFGALIKNTNAGSSAFAGINIEADSGQAGFRQYSTAHSVWAGKTLISAPSGGTGLVLLTNGTGDAIDFWTNATQALSIDASQNIVPGTAALATTATNGFIYLQTCAGAPTGVPTSYTGRVASIYDTTNNKLYVYNGGWKSVTLA